MTRSLMVEAGAAPRRLDVYLAAQLERSRSQVAALVKRGAVLVDGQTVAVSHVIAPGQIIDVADSEVVAPVGPTPPPPDLPIVYEDDDMMVIDKPAGVVVHAGNGQALAGTVADFARSHSSDNDTDRPGIVHRLDKETSGLLVIAKTAAAKAILQQRWRDREVHKTYRLLAVGRISPPAARIDLPLDRDPAAPTRRAVRASGRPAATVYDTLATYPGYSYIEASPVTGRTHQLRVHFAAVGHPIAGDVVYGLKERQLGLERQFLHAAGLELVTPSGHELKLRSPLPADLTAVLATLEETA